MDDYAAYTIPGISKIPDKIIRGPEYYIFFGDPLATVHFDAYAPWMAPPKPKKIPTLRKCPKCGSGRIDQEHITSSYRLTCDDCGYKSPHLRTPGGMFTFSGQENKPCGTHYDKEERLEEFSRLCAEHAADMSPELD
jgi:ribosomal protein S27AE